MTTLFTNLAKVIFWTILPVTALAACGPTTAPAIEVSSQPTPTPEPSSTPSPPPTGTPTAKPTDTPTPEPTPTPAPRAGLSGRILDRETDQPVADAQVSVADHTATTNADGRYTLTGLPPGQYVLSVTHSDYDPALSGIFALVGSQDRLLDLHLYAPESSPYPEDPMLTNPLDPNGAPAEADAIRLAQEQGLTGNVVSSEETKLRGEFLVNYRSGDDIRAAVADLSHEVWKLTDEAGQIWYIIKVCGNLASRIPEGVTIPTPEPRPQPLLAEVVVDALSLYTCAAEECPAAATVPLGARVEVEGCVAHGSWCQISWDGVSGWCSADALRQLAVAAGVPVVESVLPTATPGVVAGEGKIVFGSWDEGGNRNGIYVISPDGSDLRRLTTPPSSGFFDSSPAWSPNKERIVFYREGDIYVMNADGSGLTRLTNSPDTFDDHPTWSPNGLQIAFQSHSSEGNVSINIMNADGSGLTRLTDFGSSPSWSPDGTQIVFARAHDGIHVMNADGSGQIRLTDSGFFSLAWSPDSQQLVFSSSGADAEALYIMNADGSGLSRLTEGFEPDW